MRRRSEERRWKGSVPRSDTCGCCAEEEDAVCGFEDDAWPGLDEVEDPALALAVLPPPAGILDVAVEAILGQM